MAELIDITESVDDGFVDITGDGGILKKVCVNVLQVEQARPL